MALDLHPNAVFSLEFGHECIGLSGEDAEDIARGVIEAVRQPERRDLQRVAPRTEGHGTLKDALVIGGMRQRGMRHLDPQGKGSVGKLAPELADEPPERRLGNLRARIGIGSVVDDPDVVFPPPRSKSARLSP